MKTEKLTLPVDLIEKLCSKAEENGMSVTDLLYKLLEEDKNETL